MKKASKIVSFVIILMVLLTMATTVMAATGTDIKPTDMTGDSDVSVDGMRDLGNSLVKILSTAGIIVSVIVLIVLGIKYMMGSAEEKAEYKKTLLPYVIGAGLVFAASSIANIVYNFMQNV